MPLSRLENFLKNAEGSILYVSPSDFDATDSYENRGNSLTRPFKTIQRALIEAARFSYEVGRNNDKIDRTTILVYPGTHYIDNRPGFGVNTSGTLYQRTGSGSGVSWSSGVSINELGSAFNTDLFDVNNDLYKLNSVDGGVIMPRGTSIIGYDLRKTKIRPLFVPDPTDDYIAASSIFNVTGTCYFSIFTFFDADLNKFSYKNYNNTTSFPNYSHHKLTAFVYADGVNTVNISGTDTGLTDLQMYYNKLTLVYGNTSGRALVDYPSGVDFEPNVDEYRIVGNLNANNLGITSIRAGDGVTTSPVITVTTNVNHELYVDTPILISGVGIDTSAYNGSFVVSNIVGLTTFTYTSLSSPVDPLPNANLHLPDAQVVVEADSVSSASPYIFNCSLRSVYGMSGMHADGNKATGFKSMVVAQFTGVSLQKDDNAFLEYDNISKSYKDNTQSKYAPLHTHSGSIYKPSYSNYHIKASNGGFIQCVSIFAIGYARHFLAESGGDMSITNSNSNFGAVSLESIGFQKNAFNRDNTGYITHILPPREVTTNESESTWLSLDIAKTVSAATTSNLYLYGYDKLSIPPPHQVDSYRVGAKENEILHLTVTIGTAQTTYTAPVLMQSPGGSVFSAKKISTVGRTSGINSISSNTFTLTDNHNFYKGEKVRVFSDTGESPNNIELNKVYYISTTASANQVKLSPTYSDATAALPRTIGEINNLGGILTIVSSVTDKQPGDLAHPIQYDAARTNWYINVSNSSSDNQIYSTIVGLGTTGLGLESGSTFIKRKLDNRALNERIYKVRYVIPKEAANARPPIAGFVLQESSTTTTVTDGNLTNSIELKNPKIITDASYSSPVITITTELPHNLNSGDTVNIKNITSTNNPTGAASSVFNGSFVIATVPSSKTFTISGITTNPGTFTNNTNLRTTSQQVEALPRVYRERYYDTYSVYRIDEIKKHIPDSSSAGQDGVYHLTIIASNVTPSLSNVGYGISYQNYNQDIRNLYPQLDRDNYNSDPDASVTYANIKPLGKVTTNDKKNSITKEALNSFIRENVIGFGITGVSVSGAAVTFFTDREHNLNTITAATLTGVGAGYGNTTTIYSASLEGGTGSGASVKVNVTEGGAGSVLLAEFGSIVDGGSAYTKDDVLTIAGGTTLATVKVTSINNNIGDGIQIVGCSTEGLNGVFKITGISGPKQFTIGNPNNVSTYTPRTDGKLPYASLVSEGLSITSLAFSNIKTGIATITTASHHGLLVGNKFAIVGTSHTIYDKSFTVNEVVGLSTFTFNVGVVNAIQTYNDNGGGVVFKQGIGPNALSIGEGESNLGNRASYIYAGISTTLAVALSASAVTFTLTDGANKGFKKGDFVQINSEVLRILNNNCTSVVRGQFGTIAAAAPIGTVVKKIRVIPVQFNRPSYLRASGHTFEYLGYGPGNYSTGLPQKQDRILSADEIIVSQAKEQDGGTIVYSAMNDLGEFYSGSKKLNSATGEEEIFDAPIFTYTGDDANTDLTKRLSGFFDDIVVRERITVEGGENNNQTSQFYGPVNFTQKITNTSENGIEAKNLFIKGTSSQSKLITVGISTPTSVDVVGARSGDISLFSSPTSGGYLGHIYVDNDWKRFGMISLEKDSDFLRLDKLGIGATNATFNGASPLEVNGNAKFESITVTGAVSFTATQNFSSITLEGITIYNDVYFPGTNFNGGITTAYTQRHAQGISQLYNLEVTGTAATFTNAKLTLQESLNSTYTGVSTFAGTLKVGFATITNAYVSGISTLGVTTATNLTTQSLVVSGISTLGVTSTTNLTAQSLVVSGISTLGVTSATNLTSQSLVVSGIGTLGVTSATNLTTQSLVVSGISTLGVTSTTNLTAQSLVVSGISTLGVTSATNLTSQSLVVSGIGTLGVTSATNLTTQSLVVSGIATVSSSGVNINGSTSGITTLISSAVASGTLTLPATTDTLVGKATTDTLTNKSIAASTNTISGLTNANLLVTGASITNANLANSTISGVSLGSTLATLTFGTYLTETSYNGSTATTIGVGATSLNTFSAIVARDGSGNFSAGTITATLTGTASSLVTGNSYQVSSLGIGTAPGIAGEIRATNDITAFYSSDKRLKENINPIPNALEKVLHISGNTFDWKSGFDEIHSHSGTDVGVIAQEVEKVLPQVVTTRENGYKAVQYEKIIALLIEAIKELKEEVNQLKGE